MGRGDLRTLEHRLLLNSPDQHDAFTSLTIATEPKLPDFGPHLPLVVQTQTQIKLVEILFVAKELRGNCPVHV